MVEHAGEKQQICQLCDVTLTWRIDPLAYMLRGYLFMEVIMCIGNQNEL